MSGRAVTLRPEGGFECPSCGVQQAWQPGDRVPPPGHSTTKLHSCPSQRGLSVPLVWVTSNFGLRRGQIRSVAVEREDYVGAERGVAHDDRGRAVSAVRVERADGSNDTAVFAPTAYANRRTS
jgi:hypothetical protein